MLHDITLSPELSLEVLARVSDGLSGSDLKEMCRTAAMVPVREYMRENLSNGEVLTEEQLKVRWLFLARLSQKKKKLTFVPQDFKPRPVVLKDFLSYDNAGILIKATVLRSPDDRSRIDTDTDETCTETYVDEEEDLDLAQAPVD